MEYKRVDYEHGTYINIKCDGIKYKIDEYRSSYRTSITVYYEDGKRLSIERICGVVNFMICVQYINEPEFTYKNDSVTRIFNNITCTAIPIEEIFEMVKTIINHSFTVRQAKMEYDSIASRDVAKNYSKR